MITKSKGVVIVHTALFVAFIVASLISSIVELFSPFLVPKEALFIIVAIIGMILGWSLKNGCPLTELENKLRNEEVPGSAYDEPCINHYCFKWFNLKLGAQTGKVIIITFLLLPIVVELIKW